MSKTTFTLFMQRVLALGLGLWISSGMSNVVQAQLIYDNIKPLGQDERLVPEDRPGSEGGDAAQPFNMGDHDSVASVIVPMSRWGFPEGSIAFSIWDDDGNGRPGQQIKELGILDASELSDAGHPSSISILPPVIFETPVSGLSPGVDYFLYLEMSDFAGGKPTAGNSIVIGGFLNDSGTALFEENGVFKTGAQIGFGNRLLQMSVRPPTYPCDFNADGSCDLKDLNRRALYGLDLVAGSNDAIDVHIYDITGDDVVDVDDLDAWMADAATRNGLNSPYRPGDTNLDGAVDFTDFLQLSNNFGKNRRDWGDGDFTGDKEVNFDDFLALSANFGAEPNGSAAAVPEPTGFCLTMFGILGLIGYRRRR